MIELLVVLTVIGLMGLGTTTLITNMLKLSRRTTSKNNLLSVKDNLENNIKNDRAWGFTYCLGEDPDPPFPLAPSCAPALPTNISCLYDVDAITCNEGTIAIPDIHDRNGDVFYAASNPAAGYTLDGRNCDSFSLAGNDDCPLRYELSITLDCPRNETTCLKPTIRVEGDLLVRPASVESQANRLIPAEYKILFTRTQEVIYEPLQVSYVVSGESSPGVGTGGGTCAAGTAEVRPLNTINYDAGNNILDTDLPGNRVPLNAGFYECDISASGFEALQGFLIEVETSDGERLPVGTGYSGIGNTAFVVGDVKFQLSSNGWIRIMHTCSGTSTNAADFAMGLPIRQEGTYDVSGGGTVLTTVTCVRSR